MKRLSLEAFGYTRDHKMHFNQLKSVFSKSPKHFIITQEKSRLLVTTDLAFGESFKSNL